VEERGELLVVDVAGVEDRRPEAEPLRRNVRLRSGARLLPGEDEPQQGVRLVARTFANASSSRGWFLWCQKFAG
jgi:hypothetical protein